MLVIKTMPTECQALLVRALRKVCFEFMRTSGCAKDASGNGKWWFDQGGVGWGCNHLAIWELLGNKSN